MTFPRSSGLTNNAAINPDGGIVITPQGGMLVGGRSVAMFSDDGSSLVDGGGNIAARLDNTPGADKSRIPTQSMESVAAMSTTVTVRMAPTGTYRTARVSWVNNGASGSAKLNIAANCENDVAGIVASQSALQRDAQMTMGDALLLISPIPITSLNFSSDGAITSDTHRLSVIFGA